MDALIYGAHGKMARVKASFIDSDITLQVGTDLSKMTVVQLSPAAARVLAAALVEGAKAAK